MTIDSETPSLSLDAWHNLLGLPEGCELRRLRDVPKDWEWQNSGGDWQTAGLFDAEYECDGLVVCRPKPRRWVVVKPPPDANALYDDIAWNGHKLWGEAGRSLPSWLVGDAWGALVSLVRDAQRLSTADPNSRTCEVTTGRQEADQ